MKRAAAALALGGLLAAGCAPSFHRGAFADEPQRATFAQVEGVRVRYVDRGEGPVVVLLHGFASSLDNWRHVMPALEGRHRVIALDLKGFGFSDRPPGDYSPAAQSKLVRALLDQRGVKRFAVVGHSWGGSVALRIALDAPQRVTRLALYDAWVYEEQLPTTFHWARAGGVGEALFSAFYGERADEKMALAFYDRRHVTEEFVERTEASLARPGAVAAALAAARGQRYAQVQDRYGDVKQPVLLLWGREDRVSPLAVGERLAKQLPNATLIVYPRCGHFPMVEARHGSNRDLAAFLSADEQSVASPVEPPPVVAPPEPTAPPAPAPAAPPPPPPVPDAPLPAKNPFERP